jgi:hypothetical protein
MLSYNSQVGEDWKGGDPDELAYFFSAMQVVTCLDLGSLYRIEVGGRSRLLISARTPNLLNQVSVPAGKCYDTARPFLAVYFAIRHSQ